MSRARAKPSAAKPLPGEKSLEISKAEQVAQAARLAELAIFLGCLAYALWFWMRLPGQLPTEQDYLALQAALQNQVQAGDGAAVLPFWADRAKMYLHGIPIVALPELAIEPDAERYPRLWVVAQPDLPRSDARDSLAALAKRLNLVRGPQRFGPLELWLFAPKEGRAASYDFVAHAGEAQVQAPVPLRVDWREFDFLPRRCIESRAGQAALHFAQVPVQHGFRLGLGSLGPPQGAAIQVSVDGRPLQAFPLVEGGGPYQAAEIQTGALGPGLHDVDLTLLGRAICADAVAF